MKKPADRVGLSINVVWAGLCLYLLWASDPGVRILVIVFGLLLPAPFGGAAGLYEALRKLVRHKPVEKSE
jgi:hypothetical protein